MKIQKWFTLRGSFVIACLAIWFGSALVPVAHAQSGGTLIIHRSPIFGSDEWLRLWIDGAEVQSIAWGSDYTGSISPGRHVIGVLASGDQLNKKPSQTVIHVSAGQTYEFIAIRTNNSATLAPSGQ